MKKNEALYYKILGVFFAGFITVLFFAGLILPDRDLSVKERRMLADFPMVSAARITGGGFSDDFEEYASDQIPLRDTWTGLKVSADVLLGRNESQGVYRCSDGFLIEKMEPYDWEQVRSTLEAVSGFQEKTGLPQTFVMVPNAVSVYADRLPKFAPTEDQALFSGRISDFFAETGTDYEDLSSVLLPAAGEKELLFYRTDHHWTSYGARLCAPNVLEHLGRSFSDRYTMTPVCTGFEGSLASKSGFASSVTDEIDLCIPETEPVYLITGSSGGGRRTSIYSTEGLNSSDPYTVFLGGNEGMLHIETDRIGAGSLLVFKDSYFNCFLPFLLDSYETIDVIDPRYFSDDLQMLLYQNQYERVLYFYDMNTFSEDTSLALVLGDYPEDMD